MGQGLLQILHAWSGCIILGSYAPLYTVLPTHGIDCKYIEERGGIVGTYSSVVKLTLKVRITPMETTNIGGYFCLKIINIFLTHSFASFKNASNCGNEIVTL